MAGLCPVHGPYEGASCPYPPPHNQEESYRPVPPAPLSDDDMVTDVRGGGGYADPQTAATMPPGNFDLEDDVETEVPRGRSKRGILDIEDEEETQVGSRGRREDETELAEPVSPVLAMLWVKEGDRIGKFYPIRHGTIIGRKYNKEGDLILDEPKVSSSHAKFTMEGDKFFVWDLGSTNGTFVNGKKIREATLLEENDLIKIGDTIFVCKASRFEAKAKSFLACSEF